MRRPLCLMLALALSGPGPLRAQDPAAGADVEPPVIELEALSEASASASQVFTAQVVDDRGLGDVLLYQRRAGRRAFEPLVMTPIGDSAFYSAELETDPSDLRAIEYYVQARDLGGNRAVTGFAFDPFVRTLVRPVAVPGTLALGDVPVTVVPDGGRTGARARASAPDASPTSDVTADGGVKWWHVALGVVAAGTVAALAGGGGEGGGGDTGGGSPSGTGGTVPLTIDLGEPAR